MEMWTQVFTDYFSPWQSFVGVFSEIDVQEGNHAHKMFRWLDHSCTKETQSKWSDTPVVCQTLNSAFATGGGHIITNLNPLTGQFFTVFCRKTEHKCCQGNPQNQNFPTEFAREGDLLGPNSFHRHHAAFMTICLRRQPECFRLSVSRCVNYAWTLIPGGQNFTGTRPKTER